MQESTDKIRKVLLWAQICFWIGYFVFFILYESSVMPLKQAFFESGRLLFFNVVLVYTHMFLLLPLLIYKRQYLKYALLVLTLVATCVYIERSLELWFHTHPRRLQYIRATSHLVYLSGMNVIIIVISSPIKFALDFFRLQAKQQETANRQLIAEMKYLKLQINPHFLFNTLNSLYYLTQTKSDLAPKVVEKLARLMRYLLEKGSAEKVLLSDEISFVEAYIELEKIRIAQCKINFIKEGEISQQQLPPLLFIPLVENAFKHGINKSSKTNYVDITLAIKSDYVMFEIKNQYLPRQANHPTTGIGIANLQKRLKLLYAHNFTFDTCVENQTFIAYLKLPL